ncbi:hypothetical protein CHUAL_007801 [Chamberlinius hualienensis]
MSSAKKLYGLPVNLILKRKSRFYSSAASSNAGEVELKLTDGRAMKIKVGEHARFADGCAVAQFGDTSVRVTSVSSTNTSSASFLPLTVDYRQKAAAAAQIPTHFLRREVGATEREILTGRMIDRSIRPLFLEGYNYETQLVCNLIAIDRVNNPDLLSINAASAALAVSDIPWNGPVGAVQVGLRNGELMLNPTRRDLTESSLNLVVAACEHNRVVMLEASADNVLQSDFLKAIKAGAKEASLVAQQIRNLQKKCGKKKRTVKLCVPQVETIEAARMLSETKLKDVFFTTTHDKISRDKAVSEIREEILVKLKESFPSVESYLLMESFNKVCKETFRSLILETKIRCDGRSLTDLRNISCKVDLYKPLHGSAIFQRGQTQVFCTVAFDSPESALKSDLFSELTSGLKKKNFMLHYEFPPFATNETGRMGNVSRRELGHGALAEKGLRPVIPDNFPFTIRLTSEVLESNGSSSMATVCGGSLSLMDAGVHIKHPAAGVAIGLITATNSDNGEISDYCLLTDILGIEDYMGDMDFKLAGTKKGITALQADLKVSNVPVRVIMEAVQRATDAKSEILDIMADVINTPREKKENWPVIDKLEVPVHKRAKFIGLGGYNLKRLTAETGVQLTSIDEGNYSIFAPNQAVMDEAKEMIEKLLEEERVPELEFGGIYVGKIVEICDNGVMITLYDSMKPALIHNSQLDQRKISHPSALSLTVGQELSVKYFGRDPVSGQMRLSRKVLQAPPSLLHR